MKKKGFTLIELLAVIIILAIVALISTPIILNVVDEARSSANKSSVAMYADAVKLAVIDNYFANQSYPAVNNTWIENNVEYGGERISCVESYYTETEGVTLHECTLGDSAFNYVDEMQVSADDTVYCYTKGKVYTDCTDATYKIYYELAKANSGSALTGVNQPELFNNMVAVKYDGTNWVVTNTAQEWYNYENKEWANVVVFNSGVIKNVGDTIDVATEVSQMYVWIPRYKYTIFNGNNEGAAEQEIKIKFEKGTASTGTVTCNDAISGSGTSSEICTDSSGSIENGISTYTHPAFCFGHRIDGVCDGAELTGFWVGKFENSGEDYDSTAIQDIKIIPNVRSWKYAKLGTFFNAAQNITTIYGMSNADSHLIKSMEWGAVAYLTQSEYGRCSRGTCTEIGINNKTVYLTGYGAPAGSGAYDEYGKYDTELGQNASTTGNIYGVYDMSGGSFEIVMGNMVNTAGNFNPSYSFINATLDSKYYDSYTYGSSNTTYTRGKLGDGTKENFIQIEEFTGGWYEDYSSFASGATPWFTRGNTYGDENNAGIFAFSNADGSGRIDQTSRTVITVKD